MTKLLVALGAILSVALATLSMSYMVNADRLAQSLRDAEAAATAAGDAQTATIADQQQQITSLKETITALQLDLASRSGEITRQAAEIGDLKNEVASLEFKASLDAINATTSFQATKTALDLAQQLDSDNRALTNENQQSVTEFADVQRRLNELANQNESLQSTLAIKDTIIETLRQRIASVESNGETTDNTRVTPFTARVTSVETDTQTGRVFVGMNIGSAERLRPGARLEVRRANQWVATIVVTEDIDQNSAVAVVDSIDPGKQILERDAIYVGGQ